MNLIKTLLIASILIVSNQNFRSQVFGYMGQRFSSEINIGGSFSRAYGASNFTYAPDKNFVGKLHPEININYTIGKRIDIGIDVGYQTFESNVNHDYYLGTFYQTTQYYPNLTQYQYGVANEFFYPIEISNSSTSVNIDFYFRIYSRRHIAPVGVYHQFGAGIQRLNFKDNKIEGYFSDYQSEENYTRPQFIAAISTGKEVYVHTLPTVVIPRISYRIGKKFVASNGLYLNLSAEINLIFSKGLSAFKMNKKNRNYTETSYELFYSDAYNNSTYVNKSQRFEIKLGVGKTF